MEGGIVTDIVVPAILAAMMVGLGMTLTLEDFRRVARYPKASAVGLFFQMLVLPLAAFGMVTLFDIRTELAVGVMLIAACPGGISSNIITHLAKGNTALAVTLTLISSAFSLITIPLIVSLSLVYFLGPESDVRLSIGQAILFVFLMTVPTVALGMVIKHYRPAFAGRTEKPVNIAGIVFLVALIVAVAIKEKQLIMEESLTAGPVTLTLCLATTLLGYLGARGFRLDGAQSKTIAIATGFQNSALALVIATSFLKNAEIAIGPAVYTVVMWSVAGAIVGWANRPSAAMEPS